MLSSVETYIASLRRRLRKLPPEEAEDHVREVASHLSCTIAELEREGMTPEEAATEALRRIGSDASLAEKYVGSDKPLWRSTRWIMLATLLAGMAPLSLMFIGPEPVDNLLMIVDLAPLIFFACFIGACLRTRRIIMGPVLAAMAVSILIVFAVVVADGSGGVHSANERKEIIASYEPGLADLKKQISAAETLVRGGAYTQTFRHGDEYETPISDDNEWTSYHLPFAPFTWSGYVKSASCFLTFVKTEPEARRLWQLNGLKYKSSLQAEVASQERFREDWRLGRTNWGYLLSQQAHYAIPTLIEIAFLWLCNILVLLLLKLKNRWTQRRWNRQLAS